MGGLGRGLWVVVWLKMRFEADLEGSGLFPVTLCRFAHSRLFSRRLMHEFTADLVGKWKHNQRLRVALSVGSSQHPRRA